MNPPNNHQSIAVLLLASIVMVLTCATGAVADLPAPVPAFPGSDTMVLDPAAIPKYVQELVIPPVMPKSTDPKADYNIAVRQFIVGVVHCLAVRAVNVELGTAFTKCRLRCDVAASATLGGEPHARQLIFGFNAAGEMQNIYCCRRVNALDAEPMRFVIDLAK